MTWELLLLEAAVVVSQSLSSVSWVLATIHSFTVVTLGQVTYLFYGVILPEVDPQLDSTALAPADHAHQAVAARLLPHHQGASVISEAGVLAQLASTQVAVAGQWQ